jgi:hypothetical protein
MNSLDNRFVKISQFINDIGVSIENPFGYSIVEDIEIIALIEIRY